MLEVRGEVVGTEPATPPDLHGAQLTFPLEAIDRRAVDAQILSRLVDGEEPGQSVDWRGGMVHDANDARDDLGLASGLETAKPGIWVIEPQPLLGVFEPAALADPYFQMVGTDGIVLHTTELDGAEGYVVPMSYIAWYDDPAYPFELRLEIDAEDQMVPLLRAGFEPRTVRLSASKWPLSRPVRRWVGSQPTTHWPKLQREALAYAAMPRERPHIDEIGYHAAEVLPLLRQRREPRITPEQRDLMRRAYIEALTQPELRTKEERLTYVQDRLSEEWPDHWPASGWYRRLQPVAHEMDVELERAGELESFQLQPGSFTLPDGWRDVATD